MHQRSTLYLENDETYTFIIIIIIIELATTAQT